MVRVIVVIPAYNEAETVGEVVRGALRHADEVVVVDDGSSDGTGQVAASAGARVVRHEVNRGYVEALRTGFRAATGDVIVTMDADGQHSPDDIPRLLEPILEDRADLVLGARDRLAPSERLIALLTSLRVRVRDASTGFRAIRADVAKEMEPRGLCTCGTFVLEAARLGVRVAEVNITVKPKRAGRSKVNKRHLLQALVVLRELLRVRPQQLEHQRQRPDEPGI